MPDKPGEYVTAVLAGRMLQASEFLGGDKHANRKIGFYFKIIGTGGQLHNDGSYNPSSISLSPIH